jgi:methyl-accepting chemotaxis protein
MKQDTSIRFLVLSTLAIAFLLVLISTLWFSARSERQRIENFTYEQVNSRARSYFDAVNTMMLTGSISKREVLRDKLRADPSIIDARILRSAKINSIFGPGLDGEQARDQLDRRALRGETVEEINDSDDGRVLTVIQPIKAESDYQGVNCHSCHQSQDGDVLGAVRIDYSLAHNDEELLGSLVTESLVQILLFFIAFSLTAWVLNHMVVNRLRRLHDSMGTITANSDLTIELEVLRNDEIGSVSRAFNRMVGQINDSLCQVVDHADQVNRAASAIANMAETTGNQVSAQKKHTDEVASAMTQMAASAVEVQSNAMETTKQSQHTSTAASSGEKKAQTAVKGIESLNKEVQAGALRIQQLSQRTDDVASVLAVISSIAEQTNLLALNAAIEAARAGEQGRGFAVVADEVRTLASRTQESTEQIRTTIDSLRSEASDCVGIMDKASELAEEQVQTFLGVAEDLHGIADAVKKISTLNDEMQGSANEQCQNADNINNNVLEISEAAQSTATDAKETANIAEEMLGLSSQLEQVVAQFKLKR